MMNKLSSRNRHLKNHSAQISIYAQVGRHDNSIHNPYNRRRGYGLLQVSAKDGTETTDFNRPPKKQKPSFYKQNVER